MIEKNRGKVINRKAEDKTDRKIGKCMSLSLKSERKGQIKWIDADGLIEED